MDEKRCVIHDRRMSGLENFNREVEESFKAGLRGAGKVLDMAFSGLLGVFSYLIVPALSLVLLIPVAYAGIWATDYMAAHHYPMGWSSILVPAFSVFVFLLAFMGIGFAFSGPLERLPLGELKYVATAIYALVLFVTFFR
jgi:hypothetical protein